MKLLSLVLLLFASIAFALLGCSDNSAVPVSPTEQSVGVPGPLAKSTETPFAGMMWQDLGNPGFVVDAGVIKHIDGKTTFKGVKQMVVCEANFPAGTTDLFSGTAVVTMDGYAGDNGEGVFYGKLTLTPTNGGDGVWELAWHAKGTYGPLPNPVPGPNGGRFGLYGWTLPLKEEGPGKGGNLTGMHVFMENNIYLTPDFRFWTGAYTGYVKSH